jgi:hypothetical protein
MESSDRKVAAFCEPDRAALHEKASSALSIGANVSMPLHFLGYPVGYPVPLLWCFPASLLRSLWASNMAAWIVFPWFVYRNGYSHFVRSDLAPKLRSPRA